MKKGNIIIILIFIILFGLIAVFYNNLNFSVLDAGTISLSDFRNGKLYFNNDFIYTEEKPTIVSNIQIEIYNDDCTKQESTNWYIRGTIDGEAVSSRIIDQDDLTGTRLRELGSFDEYVKQLWSLNLINSNIITGKHEVCTEFAMTGVMEDDEWTWRKFGTLNGNDAYYYTTPANQMFLNYFLTKVSISELANEQYCDFDDFFNSELDINSDCGSYRSNPKTNSYKCYLERKWSVDKQTEMLFNDKPSGLTYYKQCVDIYLIRQTDVDSISQSDELKRELEIILGDIDNLNATLQEKILLVNSLELSIQETAEYIEVLAQTSEEQAYMISQLTVKIEEQAQLINILTNNLEEKAALVALLQSENVKQAELIKEMKESFENQGIILEALNKTIEDDAEIISSLTSNLDEQSEIISQLKLSNQELQQIIVELQKQNTNLQELVEQKQNKINVLYLLLGIISLIFLIFLFYLYKKRK